MKIIISKCKGDNVVASINQEDLLYISHKKDYQVFCGDIECPNWIYCKQCIFEDDAYMLKNLKDREID